MLQSTLNKNVRGPERQIYRPGRGSQEIYALVSTLRPLILNTRCLDTNVRDTNDLDCESCNETFRGI